MRRRTTSRACALVDARTIVAECNPYAEWPQWGDSALLTLPWRTRHNASVGPVVFADGVVLPLGGPIAAARRGRGGMPSAVPLILATMAQETDFSVEDLAPGADRAELAGLVRARFGTFDASPRSRAARSRCTRRTTRARATPSARTRAWAPTSARRARATRSPERGAAADGYDAPVWRLVTTATLSHGTHFMGHEQHFAFHALDLFAGLARREWNPEFGGPPYAPSDDDDALGAGLRAIHLELARDGALANATRFPPFGGAPGVPEGRARSRRAPRRDARCRPTTRLLLASSRSTASSPPAAAEQARRALCICIFMTFTCNANSPSTWVLGLNCARRVFAPPRCGEGGHSIGRRVPRMLPVGLGLLRRVRLHVLQQRECWSETMAAGSSPSLARDQK